MTALPFLDPFSDDVNYHFQNEGQYFYISGEKR